MQREYAPGYNSSETGNIDSRAANLNSNSIVFAELELELDKTQSSSSSLIECLNFIDSNLSKRSLAYF